MNNLFKSFIFLLIILFSSNIDAKEIKIKCIYERTLQNDKFVIKDKYIGNELSFVFENETKDIKSYPYESIALDPIFLKNSGLADVTWIFKLKTSEKYRYSYSFTVNQFSSLFLEGDLSESFYSIERKDIVRTNYYECEESMF